MNAPVAVDDFAVLPWYMVPETYDEKISQIKDESLREYATAFLRDGYVVIEDSIDPAVCEKVMADFRRFEERNMPLFEPNMDADRHYPRMVNMHLAFAPLRKLFYLNTSALALQDALFESETVLYTSLFYERGSGQSLHRDTPYFCTRPEYRYFGMWVAMEDVDEANGPLMAMRGGHLLPELDRQAIAIELYGDVAAVPPSSQVAFETYQGRVVAQGEELELPTVTLPVKKGSTILWHPQLPHGGAAIQDFGRTRFSLVMHTTPANTPVYHQHVFFNPDEVYSTYAPWAYVQEGGRRFADHGEVSFGHTQGHAISEFQRIEG